MDKFPPDTYRYSLKNKKATFYLFLFSFEDFLLNISCIPVIVLRWFPMRDTTPERISLLKGVGAIRG